MKPPLGSGERFAALKSTLARRPGVTNPGALAAAIGRKKYGATRFAKLSARGRKNPDPAVWAPSALTQLDHTNVNVKED